MKKGIVVTKKNMATILDHLRKIIEKKKFLKARNFYTRSLNEVKRMESRLGGNVQALQNEKGKFIASRLMFGTAGITFKKSVFGNPFIWLNTEDYGYFNVREGNKIFISGNKIYIERTDFAIKGNQKFIMSIS